MFVRSRGVAPLLALLQTASLPSSQVSARVLIAALELTNAFVRGDPPLLEMLCLLGIVPIMLRFCAATTSLPLAVAVRVEAAEFTSLLASGSATTRQMLVACGGLNVLAALCGEERELARWGVEGACCVL